MSLVTPDLTGSHIACRVDNDQRLIIKDSQLIEFHDSVFADSIEVVLVGSLTQPLVKDLDWSIEESDIDYEAMAAMRLREPDFTSILVKSITMIKTYVADYKISLAYQKLYPVPSTLALQNKPVKVEFTPEVLWDMLETIKRHDLLLAPITDVHGQPVLKNPMLLEPDPKQERNENMIVNEVYSINVPNRVAVIHPINGAFFKDSLTITREDVNPNDPLVYGEDYIVYGYDSYKTANTINSSGVYKFICFLKPFVCNMVISYHAYGGDPTLYDVKAHEENINNIVEYIINAQLLTADTVQNAPVIVNMLLKLSSLEEEMRRLAQSGRPSYGDATHGTTLLKKITSTDTKFHWWTIAELYKVAGSDDVFVSDTMVINVQTLITKYAFTAYVNVNLDNPVTKLNVTCPSSLHMLGYTPYKDYSELDELTHPQFRIIWNQNAVQGSGIYLQLGMALKKAATETICIEDVSGLESCWKLIPSPDEAVRPEDTTLTLPSNNHIWSVENPDSRQETYLVPLQDGSIIWAGTEALNRPTSGRKDISLVHFLEESVDISRIKKMRFDMEEVGANKFPVFIDMGSDGTEDMVGNTSFYYNGRPAYIIGHLRRNPVSREIELVVGVDITAGLASTQLNLRHVVVYS